MASNSMSKSTSMSKQQNSGPNPWAVAGLAALGGAGVAAAGVGIYHHVHGKNMANSDNIAMGEEMIRIMQEQNAQ